MAETKEPINSNINTNNVNVKVDVKSPKRVYSKKKSSSGWLIKTIIGAVITIVAGLIIHYLTSASQVHNPPGSVDKSHAITGIKQ